MSTPSSEDDELLALLGALSSLTDEPAAQVPAAPDAEEDQLDKLLAALGEPPPADAGDDGDNLERLLAALADPPGEEAEGTPSPADAPAVASAPAPVAPPPAAASVAPPPAAVAPPPPAAAAPVAPPPAAAPVAPPPPSASRAARTPPVSLVAPADYSPEEVERWQALDALIQQSWAQADADRGRFWFTVVGRQGPPVILLGSLDTEPNKKLARPDGALGARTASQSGNGLYFRFADRGFVQLQLQSGIGATEARQAVAAEVQRLGYFAGLTVKF